MDYEHYIQSHPQGHRRVMLLEIEGRRYWVKREEKNSFNALQKFLEAMHAMLRRFAGASTLPSRLEEETRCAVALRRRGMITPQVVHRNADYVVLSDIGPSLQEIMPTLLPPQRLALVLRIARTFADLHGRHGWHGAAVLRNLTQHADGIGMLDFEGSSSPVLPLAFRQAHDLWQTGNSLARFDPDGELIACFLKAYGTGRARRILHAVACSLSPFALLLKPFQRHFIREIRQAMICLRAILKAGYPGA